MSTKAAAATADRASKKDAPPPEGRDKNNVRVGGSRSKFVYADLTKHLLNDGEQNVVLTALNVSISEAVSVVEMLKSQGAVTVSKIRTSRGAVEGARRESSDKIEITVIKAPDFDKVYSEQLEEREQKGQAKSGEEDAAAADEK